MRHALPSTQVKEMRDFVLQALWRKLELLLLRFFSAYPSSLLVLTGDPCAWCLDLESGGLGFSPLGGVRSAGVEATSQRKIEGHDAAVSCCDVSKNGEGRRSAMAADALAIGMCTFDHMEVFKSAH